MTRSPVERRPSEVSLSAKELRRDLVIAEEQLGYFTEATDEARLRALVSETPLADREHREAKKHSDAMARHRDDLLATMAKLEEDQDELLDRFMEEQARHR